MNWLPISATVALLQPTFRPGSHFLPYVGLCANCRRSTKEVETSVQLGMSGGSWSRSFELNLCPTLNLSPSTEATFDDIPRNRLGEIGN